MKSGFTLLELLMILMVISIIATIAMSNINSSKRKARDIEAKNYLVRTMQAQEEFYTDQHRYYGSQASESGRLGNSTPLHSRGLKNAPAGVEVRIIQMPRDQYCVISSSSMGSGASFSGDERHWIRNLNVPISQTTAADCP